MILPLSQIQWQPGAPSPAAGTGVGSMDPVEWLETDGRGGFACSSVTLCPSRRYHGLLVTAPPGMTKRHLFLAGFLESATVGPDTVSLSSLRHSGDADAGDEAAAWPRSLRKFSLVPWPRASFTVGTHEIRREILMQKGHPTVLVHYHVVPGSSTRAPDEQAPAEHSPIEQSMDEGVVLTLSPLLACREADKLTFHNEVLRREAEETPNGIRCQPYDALPPVTLSLESQEAGTWNYDPDPQWVHGVQYDTDIARGYEGREDLFTPGRFEVRLRTGESITLAATIGARVEHPAEAWAAETDRRRTALPAKADLQGRCALAADDFLYEAVGGRRGVLAGFPWFGEWGRDTFIALPGLTLARGQLDACAAVLSGARPFLRDGLLPNIFGRSQSDSHYGSVDASLWFARAVLLYQRAGGDPERVLEEYLPALREIAQCYRDGTAPDMVALGVQADEGMLIQAGSPTLNPTWMDANASGVAVTPRHGCAVEIGALWYSLLAHLAELTGSGVGQAEHASWKAAAARARKAFLSRFWLEEQGSLADVWRPGAVDASVRPNMVLAAALEFSPLSTAQRARVLAVAERELLTPYGLRTLARGHESYVARYTGDPEQRDRAYHQGTVWPWLLGFFCEAALRVDGTQRNRSRLRALWDAFTPELASGGLNHISEVYDAEPPHERGGTFAQAWNTAELLRAFALLDEGQPLTEGRNPGRCGA
jgi:predicted glycogen debranching enzyme